MAAAVCSSLQAAPCARAAAPGAPARAAAAAAARLPARPAAVPRPCRQAAVRAAAASSSATAAADVAAPIEVLRKACRTKQVPADDVIAAMQAVEAAHARQPLVQGEHLILSHLGEAREWHGLPRAAMFQLGVVGWEGKQIAVHHADDVCTMTPGLSAPASARTCAGFPAALSGTWRLVFSAPTPIKMWAYIPVLEDAVIDVDAGACSVHLAAKWDRCGCMWASLIHPGAARMRSLMWTRVWHSLAYMCALLTFHCSSTAPVGLVLAKRRGGFAFPRSPDMQAPLTWSARWARCSDCSAS